MENTTTIKFGVICEKTNYKSIESYIEQTIINSIKIYKDFDTGVYHIQDNPNKYNFIFVVVDFDDFDYEKNVVSTIKKSDNNIVIFLVDNCPEMTVTEDDELIFVTKSDTNKYNKFVKTLNYDFDYKIYRVNTEQCMTWTIINDKGITNLSNNQIDLIFSSISSKKYDDIDDKKRFLKSKLKTIDTNQKIEELGQKEILSFFEKRLKVVSQKKIVCNNYLALLKSHIVTADNNNTEELIVNLLGQDFMKGDMLDTYIENMDNILNNKIQTFITKNSKMSNDKLYTFFNAMIKVTNALTKTTSTLTAEINKLDDHISKLNSEELSNITDLNVLKSKLIKTIDKSGIKSAENLCANLIVTISDNAISSFAENDESCLNFLNFMNQQKFSKDIVDNFVYRIINKKIELVGNSNNSKDVRKLYPDLLLVLVIPKLSSDNFVYKKIYMCVSKSKNVITNKYQLIDKLTPEEYNNILSFELTYVNLYP
jgi:hypothetical protein